jgi:hypothetical protein
MRQISLFLSGLHNLENGEKKIKVNEDKRKF